jgi:hypothetical protein
MLLIDVKREQMIDGMEAIIRRLCRTGPRGDLVLMYDEYSPRELAIKLLAFVEGRETE